MLQLLIYTQGKQVDKIRGTDIVFLLKLALESLSDHDCDEYEIVSEKGIIMAHAYTEDSNSYIIKEALV